MNPGKYVVFALDKERYGLPIEKVQQILPATSVTRVPHSEPEVLGVFDLRGETMTVVDTRFLLGIAESEPRIFIVVECEGRRVALTADIVDRIEEFTEDDIEEASEWVESEAGSFVGRKFGMLTVLLEPKTLLARGSLLRPPEAT